MSDSVIDAVPGRFSDISIPADGPPVASPPPAAVQVRPASEPIARIEDKTSRIEEKLARSEAAMQRVVDRFELASSRMSEVALQSDLAAVRGEVSLVARKVRRLPGLGALVLASIVTAALSAGLTIAILRLMPDVLAR